MHRPIQLQQVARLGRQVADRLGVGSDNPARRLQRLEQLLDEPDHQREQHGRESQEAILYADRSVMLTCSFGGWWTVEVIGRESEMENAHELVLQPIVRYGFVGFSAVLLGVVIWLIRRLLAVLERNTDVIAHNTQAICDLSSMTTDLLTLSRSLHDKLISRPCIARDERST